MVHLRSNKLIFNNYIIIILDKIVNNNVGYNKNSCRNFSITINLKITLQLQEIINIGLQCCNNSIILKHKFYLLANRLEVVSRFGLWKRARLVLLLKPLLFSHLAPRSGLLNNALCTDDISDVLGTDFSNSPVSFRNLIASFFFAELEGVLVFIFGLLLGVFFGVFRGLLRRLSKSIFLYKNLVSVTNHF